jgi:hypothetical protein
MEDKRGLKREHSLSVEGSHAPSDAKTPSPGLSGSPPPPGSPSEVSSRHPRSLVFEHGGSSRKAPVVDLSSSSDEEDLIPDTSHDFKFVQHLYGELNLALLGPPGDGKVIVISDSDEEMEAHEETITEAEATPFATAEKSLTPTASPAITDEDPGATPNDSSDNLAPGQDAGKSSAGGYEANTPYASTPRTAPAKCLLQR